MQFICLANSRKINGRCVAGKQYYKEKVSRWIRPIGTSPSQELSLMEIMFPTGNNPTLLDIIQTNHLDSCPQHHQTENIKVSLPSYFDRNNSWQKIGTFPISRINELLDRPDTLWINGYSSSSGLNDQVPTAQAHEAVRNSLLFIRPDNDTTIVRIANEYENRRKIRVQFSYNNVIYILKMTDPEFEERIAALDVGHYPFPGNIYLTISLTENFNSHCYKLVAAVIDAG